MQQVSYLKRFMIKVAFKPHETLAENIQMLFQTNVFKQVLCKLLARNETHDFFAAFFNQRSSISTSIVFQNEEERYKVAYFLKSCIQYSLS
jgi:hypothetical protein